MKTEFRNFELRIEDDEPEYVLRGTAVKYGALSGQIGTFRERVASGTFAPFLRTNPDVKFLFNHSPDHVLGRTTNGTLKIIDTADSLNFRCQLNRESQEHRDLYSSIRRGDISEMSFAFNIDGADGEEFDTATDEEGRSFSRRTVKRAKIWDLSCVTNPAYPGSTSVTARSALSFSRNLFQQSVEDKVLAATGRDFGAERLAQMRCSRQAMEIIRDTRALKIQQRADILRGAARAEEQEVIRMIRKRDFPWETR
jgi:HK97 family phage prohead protease